MPGNWLFWLLFNLFVVAMLTLDLGVINRRAHVVKFREAIGWSAVWIALAGVFALLLRSYGHLMVGSTARPNSTLALEFVTGYLIEESLSVDNLFVFLLIFRYFKVQRTYQHKVLFWGILGALIMRGVFIFAGVGLIRSFHWIIYVFGAFLLYSGFRLLSSKDEEVHPERNPVLRLFRKFFRVTDEPAEGKFFVRRNGVRFATTLAVVLVVVETTDVIFAADSIPAILAITRDPFIVYTSNVFAILGLRSLFFALAGMMEAFEYLHYGLAAVLMMVGAKMLASSFVQVETVYALGAVVGILAISILASLAFPPKKKREAAAKD
jgi:tellurite resistance protein TerC